MAERSKALTLVEPDEAVREALKTLLEGRGWHVHTLENGQRLLAAVEGDHPVVVICASSLPDVSAADVLSQCREHHVPVIFLGHQTEVQNAVDLVRMGAKDFLEKPFPQNRLLNLLDSLAENPSG